MIVNSNIKHPYSILIFSWNALCLIKNHYLVYHQYLHKFFWIFELISVKIAKKKMKGFGSSSGAKNVFASGNSGTRSNPFASNKDAGGPNA